jgi:hypothetical protein
MTRAAELTNELAVVPNEPPPVETIEGEVLPGPQTLSSTIVTSNTKLAATYLVFGYRLRKSDPFYWIDNYQKEDVDKYGLKSAPYKSRCFFNLIPRNGADIQSARGIGGAFSRNTGQEHLLAYINGLGSLTPAEKHQLLFLCSAVIAEGCREAQEKREYLVKQINEMPAGAKWVRVWNGKLSVTFGRNASLETRTQLLAKL